MRTALTILTLLAIMCLPRDVKAQATEGSILGAVLDPAGAAVRNATVAVKSVETGATRNVITDDAGEYVATNLDLGSYVVSVAVAGFRPATSSPVVITVKARVRVDFALIVGNLNQAVEVTTASEPIKTDSPETGGVIGREVLEDVPNFGRNYLNLAGLAPGTSPGTASGRQRAFSGAAVTVSGASAEGNNFILDGISNNLEFSGATGIVPPPDAIQEFAIQTGQYSAEFGRAGGGVINVAIKSGTNSIHGFAYDYLRNNVLDARPYDFTGTNPAIKPLRRNQFGAGAGGPAVKNRVFFFGNYEGLRFPAQVLDTEIVPTALAKQGNFSQSPFVVYDPLTATTDPNNPGQQIRSAFANNIIPASRISPITAKLLSYYPDPNYVSPTGLAANYIDTQTQNTHLNSFNVKGDYILSPKDTVMSRYSQQRGGLSVNGWMPNNVLGALSTQNASNAALTYTHVFSPTVVNEVRIGYNWSDFGNQMLNHTDIMGQFKIPGYNILPFADGYPSLALANLSSAALARPLASLPTPFYLIENSWQFMDNVSWQVGKHALKFGGEYGTVGANRFQGQPGGGSLGFTGTYTTQIVGGTVAANRTGLPDALLGAASSFATQYAFDAIRSHSNRFSLFLQDDWRITPKLSLSLGLRYDYFGPYSEEQNRIGNFDLATGQRVIPESTRSIVQNLLGIPGGNLPSTWAYVPLNQVMPKENWLDFSPRFGFAYSARPNVVVRGGYGLFYGVTAVNDYNNMGTDGVPFFFSFNLQSELNAPININQGFPAGGGAAALAAPSFSAYYGPLDRHDPYSEKYSFNIEWSPAQNTALEIGYSGQHAMHFPTLVPGNTPRPGPGNIQSNRPYPNIGFFYQYLPVNDSNYNALEISLKQRVTHGLSVQSSFTFSKGLGFGTGTDAVLDDPYNFRYDYGPLPYDFRKQWVTSFVYQVPIPGSWSAIPRAILGNWETAGLITLTGGLPYSVNVTGQVLNNGAGTNRANVIGNPSLSNPTIKEWFNVAAFGVPATYVWGNSGKDILRAPGLASVDFALQKNIPITEQLRLGLRAEATNIFNRVQLGAPSATLGGTNFGVISTLQSGPRNVQVALRLTF